MNILYATNLFGATANGGLFIQAKKNAEHVTPFDITIALHNPWETIKMKDLDGVHIFGAGIGTYHFAKEIHKKKIPMFISPVFYSTHSPRQLRTGLNLQRTFRKLISGTWTDFGLVAEMCGWASRLFPNTNEEAKLLQEGLQIPSEKITVIPNGVDERFYNATPDEFKKSYGVENFILNVGYWGERKNTLQLLRVLKKLRLPAVLIGGGSNDEYSNECRKLAGELKNVVCIENLEHDSPLLMSAYSAAQVFVLPSLFETPGISAMEAALAGANIAITEYGGTKEYFENFAEYIEPNSEDSIEKAILASLKKEKNNTLREHIRTNFLWETVGKKTAEAYRSVLNSKGS